MQTFHIEEQRVNKINEPLLVLGLGGTGTDALLHVMDTFKRRFHLPMIGGERQDAPARTAYLSIDTDTTVLTQKKSGNTTLNVNEFFDLSLPNMSDLLDPRRSRSLLKAYEQDWLDVDLQSLNAANGAGGVRQCGRFMLCKKSDTLVRRLTTRIQSLMAVNSGDDGQAITIVVLAGLGGGTGSGTFLDVAYLVRHVMENSFKGITLTLMGYFVLPDVNLSHGNYSDAGKKVLRTNGFAALKELDFWMNYDAHHYRYVHKYTEGIVMEWGQPYNDVVLLSEKNEEGVVIRNAYQVVLETISETLLHFMADERNHGTDGFTYQSHKVNVQNAMPHLKKSYPVNYCYMAIGAASTESQQNAMVIYEAKLTFDGLIALEKNDSLLLGRFADGFHRSVLPEEEEPYTLFDAVKPLPSYFHGEEGYSYADIRQHAGDYVLHKDPLNGYLKDVRENVRVFAKEHLERVWGRIRTNTIQAIRDPKQGPFCFEEYLKDPENGLIAKLEKWRQYWQNEADNLRTTVASARLYVNDTLYPAMANVAAIERMVTERKARSYIENAEILYRNARNQIVAEKMTEVFTTLLERTRNYANLNLTTFNHMLHNMHQTLSGEVTRMKSQPQLGDTQMISFARLQEYVDGEFAKLRGGLNTTTEHVLEQLAEMSFELQIDGATNKVADVQAKQEEFAELVERFMSDTYRSVNHVRLDGVLDMTMPQASESERIDYVAKVLLPKLKSSARTMYQTHSAMRDADNSYVDYSYVSVPYDAEIMKKGLERFKENGTAITPKESEITDRLYWLNTYNCLPLCRFAMLTSLEQDYEESLTKVGAQGVHGLHLVYNTVNQNNQNRIRGTWKVLPSPVPHMLLGEPLSKRQREEEAKLQADVLRAFDLNILRFDEKVTPDGVAIFLKGDSAGGLVEKVTFCEEIDRVMEDKEMPNSAKTEKLGKMLEGLTRKQLNYGDYVEEFAKTMRLTVVEDVNTESARNEAEKNREAVRKHIAGYMIALQPELLEQIRGQIDMFDEHRKAMQMLDGYDQDFQRMMDYAAKLAQMLFLGMVRQGFGAFTFDMLDKKDEVLFTNAHIKPEEQGLPTLLALLGSLSKGDERIEPMKRRYLEDQADKRLSRLDRLTAEEQKAFLEQAQSFVNTYGDKPMQIKYAEEITEEQRDKQSRLLQHMIGTAKQYLM